MTIHTTEPFSLTQRLSLLRELMLRTDIGDTERRICWFLLLERMNAETGLCISSNASLASQLGLDIRNVERARKKLKHLKIITWSATGAAAGSASIFRFIQKVRPALAPVPSDKFAGTLPAQPPVPPTGATAGRSNQEQTKPPNLVKDGSPQHEAWKFFEQHCGPISKTWSNRYDGWLYPSAWPHEQKAQLQ